MNNKEILQVIDGVERALVENTSNFSFLVVCRAFLYISLRNNSTDIKKNTFGKKIVRFLLLPISFFRLLIFLVERCDVLVVAPAQHRNLRVGRVKVSKHQDSLASHYSNTGKRVSKLEVGYDELSFADFNSVNFDFLLDLMARSVHLSGEDIEEIEKVSNLVAHYLQEKGISTENNLRNNLSIWLKVYLRKKKIYSWIAKLKSVSKVAVVVYYHPSTLALISAFREKQTAVVEYQHGIQNDQHPMYNHLQTLSVVSPDSLPNRYLLWDLVSYNRLQKALPNSDLFSKNIVGMLWFDYYKNKLCQYKKFNNELVKLDEKNVVLLALQGFPRYFNFDLISVLKRCHSNCVILVREHPLHPLSNDEKALYFSDEDYIAKIDFQMSQENLEDLLPKVQLCISGFSTVCYEASLVGAKSLFTHPIAKEGLSEYIDNKNIVYADNELDIARVLEKFHFIDVLA